MSKISISQSLIKKLKLNYCPTKINELYILKNYTSIPTLSMQKGNYFEFLCIGANAGSSLVNDLPRLKNGSKSTDQQRIEAQSQVFKDICIKYNINIYHKQVKITEDIDENYQLEGTIDFMGSITTDLGEEHPMAIFDIKLTGNIYNEYGDYSWKYPVNMDHTQPYMYNRLMQNKFQKDFPFFYLVFDYKVNSEYTIIQKKIDSIDKAELEESIRKTIEKLDFHKANGFGYNPNYENCKDCPLNTTCSAAQTKKPINVI